KVLVVWRELLWQLVRITLVSHGNFVVAPVMGLLLCVPNYVPGPMPRGEVTQTAAAVVIVQHAFNWVVDNYGLLANWRSSVNRVAKLLIALDTLDTIERSSEVPRLMSSGGKPQTTLIVAAVRTIKLPTPIYIGPNRFTRPA